MAKFDDSGWPNIHFPVTPGKETLDYSRLFGITAGEITSFSYDDMPELADVIAYVISRSDLVEKLDLLPESAHTTNDAAMWLVKVQAAGLVLSVVDRARPGFFTGVAGLAP